jgi:hypothetical protein
LNHTKKTYIYFSTNFTSSQIFETQTAFLRKKNIDGPDADRIWETHSRPAQLPSCDHTRLKIICGSALKFVLQACTMPGLLYSTKINGDRRGSSPEVPMGEERRWWNSKGGERHSAWSYGAPRLAPGHQISSRRGQFPGQRMALMKLDDGGFSMSTWARKGRGYVS